MEPTFLPVQSRCLDSQGKANPVQQHNSRPPLISTQNNNGIFDSMSHPENGIRNSDGAHQHFGKPRTDSPFCPPSYAANPQQEKAASQENIEIILTHRSHGLQMPSHISAGFKSFFKASSQKCANADLSDAQCRPPMCRLPTALNLGQVQNLDGAERAQSNVLGRPVFPPQPSTCSLLPTDDAEPPTDDQIQSLIAEKLAYFRTQKNILCPSAKNKVAGSNPTVVEQFAGKATCLNGNKAKADEIQPKPKDDVTESASSERHQIVLEVPTTSFHEGSPLVEPTKNNSSHNNNNPVWVGESHFQDSACRVVRKSKKVAGLASEGEREAPFLKDPQYDDISDDDRDLKGAAREQVFCKNPQYEDISDDENHPRGLTKIQTGIISEEGGGERINRAVKVEERSEFCVIPLHILSLRYEAPNGENDVAAPDKHRSKDGREQSGPASSSQSFSALAASRLEVYDSPETYQQANGVHFAGHFEVDFDTSASEKQRFQKEAEHEDSSETEDSCDYSPVPERNYLTVPKHLLRISRDDDSRSGDHKRSRMTKAERIQKVAAFLNVERSRTDHSDQLQIRDSENENRVEVIHEGSNKTIIILDSDTEEKEHFKTSRRKRFSNDVCVPKKKRK